jgi:hypothetical protein
LEFGVSAKVSESDHRSWASATIQPDVSEPDESDHRKLASVTIQLDVSGPDESDHQRMESVTTAFDVSGIWDAQLWSRRIRPTASAVLDLRWCTLG